MRLTEVIADLDANAGEKKAYYGVEVDDLVTRIPDGLAEIGLIAKADEQGVSLDLDVVDAVLAFVAVGTPVILEVPFGSPLSPADTVVMAANCGVEVALLPPPMNSGEADWEAFSETVAEYTRAWLNQPNASHGVQPATGYYQVMINECLGYSPDYLTNDRYMQERYVDGLPAAEMVRVKARIAEVIEEHFGGRDGFERFAHSLAASIYSRMVAERDQMRAEAKTHRDISAHE